MSYQPGVCRYCRCTESSPCTTETGDPCAWFDRDRTVCTYSRCVGQYLLDVERGIQRELSADIAYRKRLAQGRRERRERQKAARRKKKAA